MSNLENDLVDFRNDHLQAVIHDGSLHYNHNKDDWK